jgi:hypothetical protein
MHESHRTFLVDQYYVCDSFFEVIGFINEAVPIEEHHFPVLFEVIPDFAFHEELNLPEIRV